VPSGCGGCVRSGRWGVAKLPAELLADIIIACELPDHHSLHLLYEFLLCRIGPVEARAELIRYLSGELSERVLELSREQIGLDDQARL
jgi:hypothetical protein